MELIIAEETPKRMVFDIKGAGHTLCNAVKTELWSNKHIKVATYTIKHPLIGIPTFVIETDGEVKPRKALADAASSLSKDIDKFVKEFDKAAK